MKAKRKALVLMAACIVASAALTGCRDNATTPAQHAQPTMPDDPFAPPDSNAPARPGMSPRDPDAPPPERNPDGTVG